MMDRTDGSKVAATASGAGLGSLTFLVLLVLKILGHLPTMSWFAVLTSWIWVPFIIGAVIISIAFVVYAIAIFIAWVADGAKK